MIGSRFRFVDDEAILARPTPEQLIEGVCAVESLVLIHGQSGHGKSFVTLDAGCSVARGGYWHGHHVENPGGVVYIAAEGQGGLVDRVQAWKRHHGMEGRVIGVNFILEAIDPFNPDDIDALNAMIDMLPGKQRLVIIDTWAASLAAGDGDENSAKDVGRALHQLRRIIRDRKVSIWIVHHQGYKKGHARGSTGFKAATDTEIAVSQRKDIITVENTKQRDNDLFDTLHLKRTLVPLDERRSSCVVVLHGVSSADTRATLTDRACEALSALWQLELLHAMDSESEKAGDAEGVSYSEWQSYANIAGTTFDHARDRLLEVGYVEKSGEKKQTRYFTTREGRDYLHPHVTPILTPTGVIDPAPSPPPPDGTPLRGAGDGGNGGRASGEEAA